MAPLCFMHARWDFLFEIKVSVLLVTTWEAQNTPCSRSHHTPFPYECSTRRRGAETRLISVKQEFLVLTKTPLTLFFPSVCWPMLSFLGEKQTPRSFISLFLIFYHIMLISSSVKMGIIIVTTSYGLLGKLNELIDVKCL